VEVNKDGIDNHPTPVDTDAYGMVEARKLWNKSFIDVIGLALAIGEPQIAKKLNDLRTEAGFNEPIDWEKL